MKKRISPFAVLNGFFLLLAGLSCVLPFLNVLAVSLSSAEAVSAGRVGLWPVGFTLTAYEFALSRPRFIGSAWVSVQRLVLGVGVNLLCSILAAYPLSKSNRAFPGRTAIAWFFMITMLVNGGDVSRYLIVAKTGLIDSLWALVIPSAVPAFSVAVLVSFFKNISREMEESAFLDGAGHWQILAGIYLPLSGAALATLTVFQAVAHWNEWFEGQIYINDISRYPLSSYLRNVVVRPNFDANNIGNLKALSELTDRSFMTAQIILAMLPIVLVYPFMQRYFTKGVMLGSVKG